MANEPSYIRNLRALTRAELKQSNLDALEEEIYFSGSDRATVVMFGSFVEANLESLLASRMRSDLNSRDRKLLFEYEGAVGTFSSKIIVAYALKLIGPLTRFDLDLIRLLRNEFAHSRMTFGFLTPEIKAVCDEFKIVDLAQIQIPIGYLKRVPDNELEPVLNKTSPKARFITECHNIMYRLQVAQHGPREGDFAFPDDCPVP